ncbi:HAD-IC family P-type ATPase [Candidatus Pacearchaeota archaeon]|nr:HAD-IC family P-type ATPase [Candidatus Pacearchaeota archaeon]
MEKRGLTEKEAEKRLEQYGLNEIRENLVISPIKILFRQIKKNYIIYLLIIAAALSFIVGKSITAYVILAVILVLIFTGFIQEYKAEKAIKSLKNMLVPISIVIRDGKEKEILSKNIVPGDIILLRNGEKVPADCIVIEEKELLVNESILTGESKEVEKIATKSEKDYSEKNTLFMGTFVVNGKNEYKIWKHCKYDFNC